MVEIGDTVVTANAFILVLVEYQISIAPQSQRGYKGTYIGIY